MSITRELKNPPGDKPLKSFSTPDGLQLSNEQEETLRRIERARLDDTQWGFTLRGYAGTGKTTTLAAYVRWLVAHSISVAVSAPTNKATKVLEAAVGVTGGVKYGSIHKFLGLRLKGQENGTQTLTENSDPTLDRYQVVIVDECSMIPGWMMDKIVQSRARAFIIFMGDPYQLAPIQTNMVSVPDENAFSLSFATQEGKGEHSLVEIVRQKNGHPIIDVSVAIRQSEANGTRFGRSEKLAFMDRISDSRIVLLDRKDIPALAKKLILKHWETNSTGLPVRIVAWRNAQVETYNSLLHNQLFGANSDDCPFSQGEMVIAHKEFQVPTGRTRQGRVISTRVFNSEELTVLDTEKGSHPNHLDVDAWRVQLVRTYDGLKCWVYVPHSQNAFQVLVDEQWTIYRDMKRKLDAMRKLDAAKKHDKPNPILRTLSNACKQQSASNWQLTSDHAEIRHAYATTAHKAQGSTWDTVIIDLDDLNAIRNNWDYNRALYVAVSRASNQLVAAIANLDG
jgi:exodeoxyribonuclease-5